MECVTRLAQQSTTAIARVGTDPHTANWMHAMHPIHNAFLVRLALKYLQGLNVHAKTTLKGHSVNRIPVPRILVKTALHVKLDLSCFASAHLVSVVSFARLSLSSSDRVMRTQRALLSSPSPHLVSLPVQ